MKRNCPVEPTRIFRSLTTSTLVGLVLACGFALGTTGCTSSTVIRPPAAFNVSSATPAHNLPKHEYPFDAEGNYRTDWLDPRKSSNKQVAPSIRPTAVASASPPPSSSSSSSRSSGGFFSSARSSKPSSSSQASGSSTQRTAIAALPMPPPPPPRPSPSPTSTPQPKPQVEPVAAPKPPPPPPKPQTRYHTVARGETLWAISRRYGKTVPAIKTANSLSSDLIKPGQKLKIP